MCFMAPDQGAFPVPAGGTRKLVKVRKCVTNVTYTAGLNGLLVRELTVPIQHFIMFQRGSEWGLINDSGL